MTDTDLQAHIDSVSLLARVICTTLDQELDKIGFTQDRVVIADPADAEYRQELDPASGKHGLIGTWRNADGHKCGELLFHTDGSFFAEYDVIRVHPKKPRWFVEAVTAWGRGSIIKSEARLLPVVG
jgi:hypothetical protein